MKKIGAIVSLLVAAIAAWGGHWIADQLGEADSIYFAAFIVGCGVMIIAVLFSDNESWMPQIAGIYAFSPILFLIGTYEFQQFRGRLGSEESRTMAQNVRCAAKAAGIAPADKGFVRVRIKMIQRLGGGQAAAVQKEIEERMHIRILPDCRFSRIG